jgi:hypothetical protein
MMTQNDQLIDDYLERLAQAARPLPEERRIELLSSVREHVSAALADDEPAPAVRSLAVRPLDITIVLLLLLGGFAVGLGWFVGVVLLWASTTWNTRDKLLGTLFAPGGLALASVLWLGAGESCTGRIDSQGRLVGEECSSDGQPWIFTMDGQLLMAALTAVASVVTCFHLVRRARRTA